MTKPIQCNETSSYNANETRTVLMNRVQCWWNPYNVGILNHADETRTVLMNPLQCWRNLHKANETRTMMKKPPVQCSWIPKNSDATRTVRTNCVRCGWILMLLNPEQSWWNLFNANQTSTMLMIPVQCWWMLMNPVQCWWIPFNVVEAQCTKMFLNSKRWLNLWDQRTVEMSGILLADREVLIRDTNTFCINPIQLLQSHNSWWIPEWYQGIPNRLCVHQNNVFDRKKHLAWIT